MIKFILAEKFFPPSDADKYCSIVSGLNFTKSDYGEEVKNFNLLFPNIETIFSNVLGQEVDIDRERSGVFRKPLVSIPHFHGFDSLNEWCFAVALEPTTFSLFHHLRNGEYGNVDARTALDGYKFNYRNMMEWNINTSIEISTNDGIFWRPWLFHSFENGLIQHYRILCKNNTSS